MNMLKRLSVRKKQKDLNSTESLYLQAKNEIKTSLLPLFQKNPEMEDIFENMAIPEFTYQVNITYLYIQ